MSDQATARTRPPADSLRTLRLLALAAAAIGVLLLAAAAFVLSYSGIHAVALYAGVPPRLARIYPLIFDAMLVVACAAVLSLRGAGLPSRCFAWLSMLVLLVAAATADTLHAIGTRLPHKPLAAAAAIIPWALVLIGFGLLLCMLRQARRRRAAADEEGLLEPSGQAEVASGLDALFGPKTPLAPDGSPALQEPPAPPEPSVQPELAAAKDSPAEAAGAAAPPEPAAVQESRAVQESPAAKDSPAEAAAPAAPPEPAPAKDSPAEAAAAAAPPEPAPAKESPEEAAAAAPGTAQPEPPADPTVDLAIDSEPGHDDPASDEGSTWTPRALEQQPAGVGPGSNGGPPDA